MAKIIEISASIGKKVSVAQYESEDIFLNIKAAVEPDDDVQTIIDIMYDELWKQVQPRAEEAKRIGAQYSGTDRSKKLNENEKIKRMDAAAIFKAQFGGTLRIKEGTQ